MLLWRGRRHDEIPCMVPRQATRQCLSPRLIGRKQSNVPMERLAHFHCEQGWVDEEKALKLSHRLIHFERELATVLDTAS